MSLAAPLYNATRSRILARPQGQPALPHPRSDSLLHIPGRHSHAGFSVLEILVALVVIGIGVIGVAALYTEGVSKTANTDPRTIAAELADSIAERIRANSAGRSGYARVMGIVCNPKAKPKGADRQAELEAACWEDRVEQRLPNGTGTITRDASTTPATYVIAVSWTVTNAGTASYVTRIRPE
jgi:type IV pilus modification protein PilV